MPSKQETLMLQAIWRKAGRQADPLTIPVPTPADAARLRWALYNSVRAFRAGADTLESRADPELAGFVEELSIRVEGASVVLERRVKSPMMQAVADALGKEDLVDTEAEAAQASAARVLEELRQGIEEAKRLEPAPAPMVERVTPYYRRGS